MYNATLARIFYIKKNYWNNQAMREVRASLRKHIKKEGMKVIKSLSFEQIKLINTFEDKQFNTILFQVKMNGEDMNNSYRRVVADDYRPLVSQAPVVNTKVRYKMWNESKRTIEIICSITIRWIVGWTNSIFRAFPHLSLLLGIPLLLLWLRSTMSMDKQLLR